MPHPIYGPPNHRLTRITAQLDLGTGEENDVILGRVFGWSITQRGRLWAEHSSWVAPQDDVVRTPGDWLHHVVLVALEDRPNSQERLDYGLVGGVGIQDPLF